MFLFVAMKIEEMTRLLVNEFEMCKGFGEVKAKKKKKKGMEMRKR